MSTIGLLGYFKQKLEGPPFHPGEEYKYEVVRIGTFVGWQSGWKARPQYLARAGFYWTLEGDEVKCFSCDASLRGCASGGIVDEAHRRRAPRCRMLAGTDEDNIPLLPPAMNKQEAEKGLPIIPTNPEGILASTLASLSARRKPKKQTNSLGVSDIPLIVFDGQDTTSASCNEAGFSEESFDTSFLKWEEERVKTFSSWPARERVDPVELVKAGFYYFGVSDQVKCAFCHNVLQEWVLEDVPLVKHNTFYPNCPFVQGLSVGNVHAGEQEPRVIHAENDNDTSDIDQPSSYDLAIVTKNAKHPRYAEAYKRFRTFGSWPMIGVISSHNLTQAGFFYVGYGDSVKCFSCGVKRSNWETGHNAWIEHALLFPECAFLQLMKGEAFICEVEENRKDMIDAYRSHSVEERETVEGHEHGDMPTQMQQEPHQQRESSQRQHRERQVGSSHSNASATIQENATDRPEEQHQQHDSAQASGEADHVIERGTDDVSPDGVDGRGSLANPDWNQQLETPPSGTLGVICLESVTGASDNLSTQLNGIEERDEPPFRICRDRE